ncbi:hypothetical protein Zmor_012922 [Zophobas morio]|uniref:Uncharacterized protein n=1 Tax=Zophobas morio TaxID=2755281 RepID=A0AA38IGZ0_9CUCU|nr:hypothetical protein Zmor_012922 [Zophobas morio]
MIDSYENNYKQIDDIIDERKKLGQYNVCKQATPINYRYAYSSAATTSEKFIRFDDTAMVSEGDFFNSHELKSTDSEVTVVRVRCDGLSFKRRPSKWDMHDIAIPGDGSHLGESPSMVNLATLVQQNDEYLVPLSSWDPYYSKQEESSGSAGCGNDLKEEKVSDEECSMSASQASEENSLSLESKASTNSRRPSLAGRISKFLRRHCKRAKTLPEPYQLNSTERTQKKE